jgi:serine protease
MAPCAGRASALARANIRLPSDPNYGHHSLAFRVHEGGVMSFANLARSVSRHRRGVLAAFAATCGIAFATPVFADGPNVTEVVVRFRDAAPADPAAAPTAAQFEALNRSLRTGFAASTPTLDGGFRLTLAPSLPFLAARDAVNRLRMEADVLYVNIGATDAPVPPRSVDEKRGEAPDPPLSRIIIRYRDPGTAADAAADRALSGTKLDALSAIAGQPVAHERPMAWARAYLVRLFQSLPREQVEAIAQAIALQPDVLWAQPDYIHQIQLTPNDPLFVNQWHYFMAPGEIGGANLPNAWNRTIGWSGVRTAVLDTGALFTHPDLANRFVGGYDFVDTGQPPVNPNDGDGRDPDASDAGDWVAAFECGTGPPTGQNSSWHGTHVSGTIGAATNNNVGVAGVNWVSRIVPLRVLAKCGGSTSDIADAMEWASGGAVTGVPVNPYPARVINMSLGGRRPNQTCDAAVQTAVTNAIGRGTVVVIAAGNSNEDTSFASPGNCNGVITVAAVGRTGQRASYSNFDNNDASGIQVEIAAPGGSVVDGQATVLSTLNSGTTTFNPAGHNYVQYQGTSMATPHVAGIASLMLSLKPSLTPAQVLAIIASTARAFPTGTVRDCTSNLGSVTGVVKYCGAGIINADAALTNIFTTGNGGGTMTASSATLQSSVNPSTSGSPVTFTSQVTGTAPVGTVAFMDDETIIPACGAVGLTGAGTAVCTTSALMPGSHPVRAVFTPGNTVNTPVDSPTIVQVVNPGGPIATTTQLATSLNPSAQGASVTFTATVAGFAPTGTVLFRSDGITLGGCAAVALTGAGNSRTAQCTTTAIAVGSHTIEGVYGGDAFNLTSTGSLTQTVYGPNACVVFNDVLATDPFCPNVQWLFNRMITLGCVAGSYCPTTSVSRLAMAAFMNREGTALTPVDLQVPFGDFALNLTTAQVVCTTGDYTVDGFPRRAYLRARANLYGVSSAARFNVEHVFSTDSGSTWLAVQGSMMSQTLAGGLSPTDDKTPVPFGAMDLAVGTTYRFGLRVSRVEGTANPGFYCANFVQIRNRTTASPPL